MRATLNLNAAATLMTNNAAKVRTKAVDGVLMIKPTDRACGKALPKGEKLVALSRKNASTVKFGLRGDIAEVLVIGSKLALVEAKHGWYKLVAELGDGQVSVCKG